MTRNEHAVINTLRNPVSTDVQCMHYRDTAALRKYSALACYRPDHNGQSVRFGYYPPDTRRFTVKIRPSIPAVYVILSIERCSTYPLVFCERISQVPFDRIFSIDRCETEERYD